MIDFRNPKEVELFNQVKRKCNITWEDAETNQRLLDVIASAKSKLIYKLGITDTDFDFSVPGIENDLFKNACFYEWNHASDDFERNYENDLIQCRMKHEVPQYADED